MGVTGPVGSPATPARRPKKRPLWMTGGLTILTFVALLYVVEAVNQVDNGRLDNDGIRPLQTDGLWGILFAPLLHANWQHLRDNTVPLLVLGFLVTLAGLSRFVFATAIIWIVGGFGTWLIGNLGNTCGGNTVIVGASGLIFGYFAFLLVFGWFTRKVWEIFVSLAVLFYYGWILWEAVPVHGCTTISWQGHLCGAIAGVLAAYWLSAPERKARERRRSGAKPPSPRP
jgi:membrane associated rhomboid family serine protease